MVFAEEGPARTATLMGGYSFLWCLFIVAVLSSGLALGGQMYGTLSQRDKERELIAIARQFRAAIASYYEVQAPIPGSARQNALATAQRIPSRTESERDYSRYPTSLDDLILDPRFPGTKRHLRKIFVDPMTGRPDWTLVVQQGRLVGVRSASPNRPIKVDGFDADNLRFTGQTQYSDWVISYPADLEIPGVLGRREALGAAHP